jgi:hypothetical protein
MSCSIVAMLALTACNPAPPENPVEAPDVTILASGPDIALDYPEGGVLLGQGWNSFSVGPANAICIVFQEAQSQEGQFKDMTLKSVTSDFELQRSFDMDASVQYKAAVYSVGAKASFVSKTNVKTSDSNISVYAVVDNGRSYVAPPTASQGGQVARLLREGKNPEEVNAALGITAQDVDARWRTRLTKTANTTLSARQNTPYVDALNKATAGDTTHRAIALHPDYVDLAKNDPAAFRKACGDRFVQSISKGGEVTALFSFATSSLAEQQEIKASLQGSGWGVTAEGSAESKVARLANDAKLTINAATTGGSGQDFPTDLKSFYDSIRTFPAAVAAAPWSYKISLKDYRSLPNWPGGSLDQPDFDAMQELAFHHGKWATLQRTLNAMLDATPDGGLGLSMGYLLGRGVERASLLEMESLARSNRETLEKTIDECLNASDGNSPCKPSGKLSAMQGTGMGPLSSDFKMRAQLPLPIASGPMLQRERLMPAAQLQDAVFQFWIKRSWDERCAMFPANETICLPRAQMEGLKADIQIPAQNKLVLVSLIGGKDHCASVNTGTKAVNWSACKPNLAIQQWLFDSVKRTFTSVANRECLNVRASKTGNEARLITYSCAKNANHKNDKWTLTASSHGAWMFKPGHATNYCLSTRPGAFKNGMQLGLKACSLDGKSSWNQVNWVIVGAP